MKLYKKHVPNTNQYHPENLFKLNGEGLTWEEYKQKELRNVAPKIVGGTQLVWVFLRRYPKRSLVSLCIVVGIDLFCLRIIDSLLSSGILGIFATGFFFVFLSLANVYVFSALYNALKQFASSNKSDSDNDIQNSNDFSVAGYIKDTGRKIRDFYGELEYLEVQERKYGQLGDSYMCHFYYKEARKMRLSLDDKRLPALLNKHPLIFAPAATQGETLELMAITSENNAWQWSKTIGFRHGIKGAATYSTTLDIRKLPETITQDTNRLCEFIAKPEIQQILTARMYAQQQANKVHGIAEITLPDWITNDSVLLDDYKCVKQWYINYRDMLTEKIYDLAQEHAYNLRCETERKTSRSDAISAALSF